MRLRFVGDKSALLNVRWKYVFNQIISYEKEFCMVIAFAMALAGLFMLMFMSFD